VTTLGARLRRAHAHLTSNVSFFLLAEHLVNQRPSKLSHIRSVAMPMSYAGTAWMMNMTRFRSNNNNNNLLIIPEIHQNGYRTWQ